MNSNDQIKIEQELQQLPAGPQVMEQPMIPQNPKIQAQPVKSDQSFCQKIYTTLSELKDIPFSVTIILVLNVIYLFGSLIFHSFGYFPIYDILRSIGNIANFLFVIFAWAPMARKIENCSSSARYFSLFLINSTILNVINLSLPLCISKLWCFVLFETILISFSNEEKKVKFFGFKVTGKKFVSIAITYAFIFNLDQFISVIFTTLYAYIYQKKLITKFSISNERVLKIENYCCCSCFKNNFSNFVSLNQCMNRKQNSTIISNPNNSSFVAANIYPNYYSGVANFVPNFNQGPIGGNNLQQPMVNVNMAGEPGYNNVPENLMNYEAQPSV